MLDANLKAQLKSYLERVTQPIEIVASLDDGAKSREMLELLKDVASLSSQITLLDNGVAPDVTAGDTIFSGNVNPDDIRARNTADLLRIVLLQDDQSSPR